MRSIRLLAACVGGALALAPSAAQADTMHPVLGAKLSGMGEHGIVNLQSKTHDAVLDVRRARRRASPARRSATRAA